MPRPPVSVTFSESDASRIPDLATEAAGIVFDLAQRGIVDEIGDKLRIRRQGGYSGVDVWLFLMFFMATGASVGVRKFWKEVRLVAKALAALGGRKRLMSPASLSRALSSVELDLLRPLSGWLLTGVTGMDAVLADPVVQACDAEGKGWHVFHVDPTVTTLRQRALPTGDDLPEPMRDSEETGAPGYSGRKRGNMQFRRFDIQHSGSGAWIHNHLSKGNGDGVADLELGLDAIVATAERLSHPLERVCAVLDGEFGGIPSMTACRERQVQFITRLNRPSLYKDPAVLDKLRSARWSPVPDSRSGPQRYAADIGVLTIVADRRTQRPDGSAYEPIELRVVVSIFEKQGDAQRGQLLDGWQVELFAVDVPARAWPAADAVSFYYGRAGQENRFGQEDRELGLDRIVSYHLPGQELAVLVGLSIWNYRIAHGWALEPPPSKRPAQRLRTDNPPVPPLPAAWPRDPVLKGDLAKLDWPALLGDRPDWTFDAATGDILCEDGRPLVLTTVRPGPHAEGRTGVIFRRPTGGCEDCEPRPGCLSSRRPLASKHVELSVPTDIAERMRARLALVRGRAGAGEPTTIQPLDDLPGPLHCAASLFLPAQARQVFDGLFDYATLRAKVRLPPDKPPRPRLVAEDDADRQRRRCTWQDNVERYALPEGARVELEVAGTDGLRDFIARPRRYARTSMGASG